MRWTELPVVVRNEDITRGEQCPQTRYQVFKFVLRWGTWRLLEAPRNARHGKETQGGKDGPPGECEFRVGAKGRLGLPSPLYPI